MSELALDFTPTWDDAGLCAGHPELLLGETRQARDTCRACPVLDDCRTWVLSVPLHLGPDGIVAGTTLHEREVIVLAAEPPRQCATCEQVKPLHAFPLSAPGQPYRRSTCRACHGTPRKKKGTT